jgi:MFS family permease
MGITDTPAASIPATTPEVTGWKTLGLLNRYHWFVLVVASLAWILDCMDQQLFNLARNSAVTELLPVPSRDDPQVVAEAEKQGISTISEKDAPAIDSIARALHSSDVKKYAGYATSIFLIGWAVGGIGFGIMGDRVGRVKTLTATILLYSIFTGLSAFSPDVWIFSLFRFLTGLGVGGVFAVAVTLVAETVPDRSRPFALGLLQASSAFGNCTAAVLFMILGSMQLGGTFDNLYIGGFGPILPWRLLFVVGIVPALLVVIIQGRLKEPERWRAAVQGGETRKAGSFAELLGDSRWRRNALLGLLLAFSGVVGLWGIGFFSIDLQQVVFTRTFDAEASARKLTGEDASRYIAGQKIFWAGVTSLMLNLGAFLGISGFSWLTSFTGRRPAFALSLLAAAGSTALVFWTMQTRTDLFWMIPLMGFCQLALFGGYAIYFPELFPTRLRSTGTSFCYNVGRLVAAVGPAALGLLTAHVFSKQRGYEEGYRQAGVVMCSVFLLGLLALPFLPETKGKPLPE